MSIRPGGGAAGGGTGPTDAEVADAIAAAKGLPLALTGATQPTRYVGRWSATGAPVTGTFAVGDFGLDGQGDLQVCTVAGTPGTWRSHGSGTYQPLDADLTAIAALSTTSFGRALLALADAAAGRTALALGSAAVAATTDFAPAASASTMPRNTQTGTTYTLVAGDAGKVVRCTNAGAVTVTVPPNSSVAFGTDPDTIINVYAAGAGGTTIAAGAGVTIRNNSTALVQYGECSLRKDGTDEWVRTG